MKLSQTENNIKKHLAEREIEPSAKLWDNIQSELDKENRSNSKGLWYTLSAIAALLCLCFLAYQGFQNTRETIPALVLDQKGNIEQPINFDVPTIDYVILPENNPIKTKSPKTKISKLQDTKVAETSQNEAVANEEMLVPETETEVESLLNSATENLAKQEQEKILIAEVDNLLNEAIENTQEAEQKEILKSMQARLLLAEVESDLELIRPPNLGDKIWDAIVANYNDIKNSVVLN